MPNLIGRRVASLPAETRARAASVLLLAGVAGDQRTRSMENTFYREHSATACRLRATAVEI